MTSIVAFLKQFPDDDSCWEHLERVRWPHGPVCPKCGGVGPTWKIGRAHYHRCKSCGASFTVAFGTPLEGTHLPMRMWFTAIYLLAVSSKGLSSVALARHLGIGQKTAWFLGHRIRDMMADDSGMLRGVVEADETYVGGRRKRGKASKRDDDDSQPKGRGGSRKAMILTAVERGGRVRAKRAGTHSELSIAGLLHANVAPDAIPATDELPAYRWIGHKFRAHVSVNHSRNEFVRHDRYAAVVAPCNTAESWHATFKRAIVGVWHWLSLKHLDRYCVETAFRCNFRGAVDRISAMFGGSAGRLSWQVLTA